eukprot:1194911-Prorocentrum_minimum.AAC.1
MCKTYAPVTWWVRRACGWYIRQRWRSEECSSATGCSTRPPWPSAPSPGWRRRTYWPGRGRTAAREGTAARPGGGWGASAAARRASRQSRPPPISSEAGRRSLRSW